MKQIAIEKQTGMLKLASTNRDNLDRLLDPRELYVQRDQSTSKKQLPKLALQKITSEV